MPHFKGEQERRPLSHQPDVGEHTEGEARLAHTRACPDDVQRRRLEPEQDLVELVETRRDTGDVRTSLPQLLYPVQSLTEKFAQRVDAVRRTSLRDVEHQLLRLVDCSLDVL